MSLRWRIGFGRSVGEEGGTPPPPPVLFRVKYSIQVGCGSFCGKVFDSGGLQVRYCIDRG